VHQRNSHPSNRRAADRLRSEALVVSRERDKPAALSGHGDRSVAEITGNKISQSRIVINAMLM